MEYLSISACGYKGVIKISEFKNYVSPRLISLCKRLSGTDFTTDLIGNWNRFSPQKANYELKIQSAISSLDDLPSIDFDADILRLKILQYILHNYSRAEYELIAKKIEKKLLSHNTFKVIDLASDNAIPQQIKIKEEYCKRCLRYAQMTYAQILSAY